MATFKENQIKVNEYLKTLFPSHKIDLDKNNEAILWLSSDAELHSTIKMLMKDAQIQVDQLSDLTAYDNIDNVDGPKRFIMVYQLYSNFNFTRIRIKLAVNENEAVPSIVSIWEAANWPEREVFDLFGIRFSGHPDLRRLLMDERFVGYPLRKEFALDARQNFADSLPVRFPEKKDNLIDVPIYDQREVLANDPFNSKVLINIGPNHPAMHGTLRVMTRVNGEIIEESKCEIGYLHRAIEKLAEHRTYHQWIVYTDRLNYCSALANNIAYVMAVEDLMKITPTERTQYIRVICIELSRIIDHIICVAINALDMGAMTVFWYLYEWREEAYSMIEGMCGMRLTTSYSRIGGMGYDLPDNFNELMAKFLKGFPKAIDDTDKLLTKNRIWIDRTKGVGTLTKEDIKKFGLTGPIARASGVDVDLRKTRPFYMYEDLDFETVIADNGDVYDRYLVRMEEMRQSLRILEQCTKRIPKGPIWVDDNRVKIPAKADVYTKMEVLIHHFKIFMEGIDVPPGEGYSCIEAPNGELGFYIVSRGGPKSWRTKIKSPSLYNFQTFDYTAKGKKISDMISVLGSLNIIAGELDR